jgi:hypothetical protein
MIKFKLISFLFFFSVFKFKKDEKYLNDNSKENNLSCRFVIDGLGVNLGESIALDNDIIIIKSGNKYLGIPLKHVEEKGEKLIVRGLVDRRNALKMGKSWRESYLKDKEE